MQRIRYRLTLFFALLIQGFVNAQKQGPLAVSANGHYLTQTNGAPFFWLADTGWPLFTNVDYPQATAYLDNRANHGFNVIQTFLSISWRPVNHQGERPYVDNDPLQLNKNYFDFVRYCLHEADKRQLLVFLVIGDPVRDDTKFKRLATPESAYRYGHLLGKAFINSPNIIWGLGQDYDANSVTMWNAMAEGIADAVNGQDKFDGKANYATTTMTYHPSWEASSSYWLHAQPWMDFNTIQSSHARKDNHHVYHLVTLDWDRKPAKPTLDSEPNYEAHPVNFTSTTDFFDAYDVRKASYRSVFAGGAGITYGHHAIWRFAKDWEQALDSEGARQMRYLKQLMEARPYQDGMPDQSLLASQNVNDKTHIRAFRDRNGHYALLYFPLSGQRADIRLETLKGNALQASWFNPEDGKTYDQDGKPTDKPFAVTNRQLSSFTSPPKSNNTDWVLIVEGAKSK